MPRSLKNIFDRKDVDRLATSNVPRKAPKPAVFSVKQIEQLGDADIGKDVEFYLANLRTFREGGVTLTQHVLGGLRDREGISYLPETEQQQALRAALEQGETALAHKFGVLNSAKMTVERPEQREALEAAPGEAYNPMRYGGRVNNVFDSFAALDAGQRPINALFA